MGKPKKKKAAEKKVEAKPPKRQYFLKSAIALVLVLLLYNVMQDNPGISWIYRLVKSNLEVIEKNKELTVDQRLEAKSGFQLKYLNYVKKNTPDSAYILFPKYDDYKGLKGIRVEMANDRWKSYYLYPRRAISAHNPAFDSLYKEGVFTHLAIINRKGYDLLPYKVDPAKSPEFTIIKL